MQNATLSQYIESLAGVPLPSSDERNNLVDFVADSQSWYKTPIWPPHIVFCFYLDKFAGFGDNKAVNAEKAVVPLPHTEPGPHRSMITTAEHHSRFGHLGHSRDEHPTAYVFDTFVVESKGRETTIRSAERRGLPAEIIALGRVKVSGIISPHIASLCTAQLFVPRPQRWDWPEESGGPAVLEAFHAHCRERLEHPFAQRCHDSTEVRRAADAMVRNLLAPERNRQLAQMRQAIDRVCEFVEKART